MSYFERIKKDGRKANPFFCLTGIDIVKAEPGTAVDLTSFSLLAMKGLRIKGGIVWKILPIKRYAYREMLAQGIINASGGTKRIPSGEEVVRMIGEAADLPRRAQ